MLELRCIFVNLAICLHLHLHTQAMNCNAISTMSTNARSEYMQTLSINQRRFYLHTSCQYNNSIQVGDQDNSTINQNDVA